jgi:AraC-like DNA-binding protein
LEKGVEYERRLATLLRPDTLGRFCDLGHLPPSADLAPFVLVAWTMQWTLPDERSFTQPVLPNPSVHLVITAAGTEIFGVMTGPFSTTFTGSGFIFGLRFRPCGFFPFVRRSVSEFTDRRFPLTTIFPEDAVEMLKRLAGSVDSAGVLQLLEDQLRKLQPQMDDPTRVKLESLIEGMARDPEIRTVEDAAEAFGASCRTLQRLFRLYVGVGPKWAIRRFRLKDAAARLDRGEEQDWARLANELGYFDQAHLINDFRKMVGETPAVYSRSRLK